MEEYEIKITGSGISAEIVQRLRDIAQQIEEGDHVGRGKVEWEDETLVAKIEDKF